ncbi:MAG TPA: DUF1800 domain-containing protein [Vicinamibacteria bacterium]|nr:DUF1800 domain-containing protein [Vicinamibacteria bacterium]
MSVAAVLRSQAIDVGPRVAAHALNRLGFGPRPGDVRRVLARGIERWVDDQLHPGADPDTDTRLRGFASLSYSTTEILTRYNADNRVIGPIINEWQAAKVIRAAHSENQLQEVLVDFWFNHFNVYFNDGFTRYSFQSYERDAIRPHVLGRFRDLLGATAAHPAMLFYLDNYLNRADTVSGGRVVAGVNENYGRELLELHTVGVDAGYTQDHVRDAARAFTGWGIDNVGNSGNFTFRAAQHDRNAKHVFGLDIPAGGNKEDGDRLLDYLATHPATARFVSWRLAQRFIADEPPARVVDRMASTFLSTGGDIREVVKTMVSSAEFWAEAFGSRKVKTPFEYVVGAIRAVEGQVTGVNGINTALNSMGMPLFGSLDPTGFSNAGERWLNPSAHLYRMNFGLDLAANAVAGVTVNSRDLVSRFGGNPDDARSVVSTLNTEVFGGGLSSETFAAASGIGTGGSVGVAVRAVGLVLAGPEMQVR